MSQVQFPQEVMSGMEISLQKAESAQVAAEAAHGPSTWGKRIPRDTEPDHLDADQVSLLPTV